MSNENKTSDNLKGHAPLAGVVARFLRRNCKPLMVWYYNHFENEDMLKCLKLFDDYIEIEGGIDIVHAISILESEEGWDWERAANAVGKCVYCGFLV